MLNTFYTIEVQFRSICQIYLHCRIDLYVLISNIIVRKNIWWYQHEWKQPNN